MDDYRQQQIDVLKEAVPYSEKLIGAIEKVSEEINKCKLLSRNNRSKHINDPSI
jgi:hypothetical protein